MAVGDSPLPPLHPVAGVRLASGKAGIRRAGERDVVALELSETTRVAATFTRNQFRAAPVRIAEAHLAAGAPRYLLINTGNANAGTGAAGELAARSNCQALANLAGCRPEQVIPFSTGVIGEALPAKRIDAALPDLLQATTANGWADAADAIRTTDTRPKGRSLHLALDGGTVTLTGIAKGSGMIRPDMATMLAFVATDADIPDSLLRRLLRVAVAESFNRITVDGDTSTNDACVLMATGESGVQLDREGTDLTRFREALTHLCQELAREIVADGEGATRVVSVRVREAASVAEAERTAFTVAESPLVKTALFAGDPNWGRILAAVGRAGMVDLAVEAVAIAIDDVAIAEGGCVSPHYNEAEAAKRMAQESFTLDIALGRGDHQVTVWTCDLSYEYIRINADYRS